MTKSMVRGRAVAIGLTTGLAFSAWTVLPLLPATAQQATQVYAFRIPAKPIRAAVNDIASVTGINVVFAETPAASALGNAVQGSLTPAQAVSTLLAGTDLSYSFTGRDTVTIAPVSPRTTSAAPVTNADGSIMLEAITLQAGQRSSTIGALSQAYAGGQVATGGQLGMLGNRSVMDTPFSQISYTNRAIVDQQAQTVNEVIDNDASIITTSKGSRSDSEVIRGFQTLGRVGVRSLNGLSGMAPLEFSSSDYVERVEVLKGPSALLNGMTVSGSGNLGGTVNLVSKQATDEPITRLTTRYATDAQVGLHVDVGRRFGPQKEYGLRFNGSLNRGDTPINTQKSKDFLGALNLDYQGDRLRVSADLLRQSQTLNPPANFVSLRKVQATMKRIPDAPDSGKSLFPRWDDRQAATSLGMLISPT